MSSTSIPKGYKQTEVGVIPEDWGCDKISKHCSITTGSKNTQDKVDDGAYPFYVRSQDVERINSYSFDGEGVLTAGDGVGTGKIFHYINGKCDIHQRVYLMHGFGGDSLDGKFFYRYFSQSFYSRMMQMTAKSSVDSVRREMIADMVIPLPPLPEQKAIAQVLSDTDALIASLDKLIAKKKAIKQGAMQELLTGRRRIGNKCRVMSDECRVGSDGIPKGYKQTEVGVIPEEWEVRVLGELCSKIGSGITPTGGEKGYKTEGRHFIRSQNVGWGELLLDDVCFIDEATHQTFSGTELQENDVLLNITGASIGRSAIAKAPIIRGNVNQHVCIIRAHSSVLNEGFLNRFILSNQGQSQIDSFQTGGNRQGLNFAQIASFQIPLPPLPEQKAIAQVLSDMDSEIAELEEQREKSKALKQGLMQVLLTGKVRLV